MAGLWIKIEHMLPGKPEVIQLADRLEISEEAVVGHLVRFWSWVDQNLSLKCPATTGTRRGLDRVAQRDGFADAMIAVGWLEIDGETIRIPNYDAHLSQSAKQRALESRKKMRQRQIGDNCPEGDGTQSGQNGDESRDQRKRKRKSSNKKTIQKNDYSTEFDAWWCTYPKKVAKGEAGKAYPKAVALIEKSEPDHDPHQRLQDAAISYSRAVTGKDPQYIANPATWLNAQRWLDEALEDTRTPEQRLADYREATR